MRAAPATIIALCLVCAPAEASLPQRIGCVATDTFWIWYGNGLQAAPEGLRPVAGQAIAGSRLLEPQEQFRIEDGSLFLLDGFRKEYLYGSIEEIGAARIRAGDWTFMFSADFVTATGVRVDELNTRACAYLCVVG